MLVQPQTALDELPRAVDDLRANLDSQLSSGRKGDFLELDVRRLLPRPHATGLNAYLLVDDGPRVHSTNLLLACFRTVCV